MIEVRITADLKGKAKTIAERKQRENKGLKNYNPEIYKLDMNNRWYTGILGELVFEQLLIDNSKQYKYESLHAGKADEGDFTIELKDYGKFKLDVKTCSQPGYVMMLTPKKAKRYPLYVGVRMNGEVAEIHGVARQEDLYDVTKPKPRIPCIGMRLDELHDIAKLLGVML